MRKSRIRLTATVAAAIAASATMFCATALHAETPTDRLAATEQLLQDGQIIEARYALIELTRTNDGSIDADHLLELRAAAERRLRFMPKVEVSLQKAELALKQGDLRLADTHARAAQRHNKATTADLLRANAVLKASSTLREELTPMIDSALVQAIADFDAERYSEAKAGLGSVVRIGATLSQRQAAHLNRYRDQIYQLERDQGEPFEVRYIPLSIIRGAPTGATLPMVEVIAAAAIAQDQGGGDQADPLQDTDRFDAERILAEANAAFNAGRFNEASEKYQIAITRYARFLSAGQLAQARQNRLQSQVQMGGQDAGALEEELATKSIMVQEARAEFSNSLTQSQAALNRGDINSARNLAAQARFRWTDVFNNGLFSDDDFREGIGRVNALVTDIDRQEEQLRLAQIKRQESDLRRAEASAVVQQESERRARINEGLDRMRALQREHKYDEALEVAEQVLFLDPDNPAAELVKDVLKDLVIYREFESLRRNAALSYARETLDMQQSMIIPSHLMDYPSDWPEISFRRGEVQSFVESNADRRTLAALGSKSIPASFTNNRLEDVLSYFASVTNLNVDVDWDSMERIGVGRDMPVSLELRDVPARVVLNRVLEKTKTDSFSRVDWAVNDGVLVIAAEEALRRNTFVVIYDIRDLLFEIPDFDVAPLLDLDHVLDRWGDQKSRENSGAIFGYNDPEAPVRRTEQDMMERVLEIIQTNVDFEGWRDNGGSTGVVQELNGNLIVTNTAKNHRQIQGLLNQLREIRSVQINVESRFLTVAQDFFEQIGFDLDIVFNAENDQFDAVKRQLEAFGQGSLANEGLSVVPSDIVVGRNGANVGYTFDSFDAQGNPLFAFNNLPFSIPAPSGLSSTPVFQDSINLTDALVRTAGSSFADTLLGAGLNPALSIAGTFLDDVQVDFLIEATQADKRNVTLSAPRLTFSNGRAANIAVINQVGFISDLTPVVGTGSVAFDPTVGRINEGFSLAVRGVASADRRYVTLTVQAGISRLTDLQSQTITAVAGGGGGGTGNTIVIPPAVGIIQIPTIDVTQVNTAVTIPDKGTILLGGQRLTNEVEMETGVPVLSKLPIINRFFTNRAEVREERTLLILMKPTIIIQSEREEEEFPGLLDQLRNPFR